MLFRYASAVLTLLLASPLAIAATVTVPDLVITEGTSSLQFIVTVAGGEAITSINSAIVIVDDGGPTIGGGESTPRITSVDFSQSILNNAVTAPSGRDTTIESAIPLPSATISVGNGLVDPATDFVVATGELFRFTVDTSALTANEVIPVTMDSFDLVEQQVTFSQFGGGMVTPSFTQTGSITVIDAVVVPEPSSLLAVASIGGVFFMRRRQMRGRHTV